MDETLRLFLVLNSIGLDSRFITALEENNIKLNDVPASEDLLVKNKILKESQFIKLSERLDVAWADNELKRSEALGFSVVSCRDNSYPVKLCDLKDYPLVLYFKGNIEILKQPAVSVVGTRKASSYARRVAYDIGKSAAFNNAVLVSGGALGIDSCAHSGVYDSGGNTCVVMGTSPDKVFPASNAELFSKISERGILLSEFPVGSETKPWNFPKRNRLIAALSEKIIVVEAPEKSGALITARISMELGREVWAVPGHITDDSAAGTNRLIYDGAYPYISEKYFWGAPSDNCEDKLLKKDNVYEDLNLSEMDKSVLEYIKQNEAQTADSIANGISCSSSDVLISLSILTVKGLIYKSGTGRYSAG